MSSNKTRPTAVSVDEFIAGVDTDQRRKDCLRLKAMIEEAAGEPAVMWGPSMIGAGSCHYRYESGREGDMFAVGFAPRSGKISLYLAGSLEDRKDDLDALGKHTAGKGCVYIKSLAGLDLNVLARLFADSVATARELYIRAEG
jgi:hypothetical protein